jgi:hypothetical protein
MGASASAAAASYHQVAENREVWAIRDAGGFLTATNARRNRDAVLAVPLACATDHQTGEWL